MNDRTTWVRLALAAALSVLSAGTVLAAEPAAGPDMETQTFGSWTMRCISRSDAVPPCDIVQGVTNKESGKQVMQLSFAYLSDKSEYAVQLLLPLGFMIPSGVLIRIEGGPDITDWPVTRCEPQGCLVERLLAPEILEPFRSHETGTVAVLDTQGKPVGFPLALGGFAAAADAMTGRNKAAAKKK